MLAIAALMTGQRVTAQGLYIATDGSTGANDNEGFENLLDDNKVTKWCVTNFVYGSDPIFVEFETPYPIIPVGYTLTTANDTQSYPERNPISWTILAKNEGDKGWTTIASVQNDNTLDAESFHPYEFSIDNTAEYQYFRFEISALTGYGDSGEGIFQLSEFSFKLQKDNQSLYQATVEGIQQKYNYTGSAIDVSSFTVKDADNYPIDPSEYTYSILNQKGEEVQEVINPGMYRLVITPSDSDYKHQKVISFEVYPWSEGTIGGYCGRLGENYGQNVYYYIVNENKVKTLYIKANPGSPEDSYFGMEDYSSDFFDEYATFAPWIEVEAIYQTDECDPEDPDDDVTYFDCYDLSCDIDKVVIGEGVTYIGQGAFCECRGISSVVAPSTLEEIHGWSRLDDTDWWLNHPEGVVYLGSLAWMVKAEAPAPNFLIKDGTVSINAAFLPSSTYENIEDVESVVIPASVKRIDVQSFEDCYSLKTVTIGAGVEYIGSGAFCGCENVTDVYCYANPYYLTWESSALGDFSTGVIKTKCHVLPEYLEYYISEWNADNNNINVDFVGDLAPQLEAKKHAGKFWTTYYNSKKGHRIADSEPAFAYTATYQNNTLTLHKLGKVIPAGTAVIVISECANVSMIVDNESVAEYAVSNDLKGTNEYVDKPYLGTGTFYVLSKLGDDFGFFEYTADFMPAHKAYLLLDGVAQTKGLKMVMEEDDATSVNGELRAKGEDSASAVYDLSGRRFNSQLKKGIYIINGKKVLK